MGSGLLLIKYRAIKSLHVVSELGSLVQDPSMATTKINLEKFNGKNDFNMWKVKMEAVWITQGFGDALKPASKKEGKKVSP